MTPKPNSAQRHTTALVLIFSLFFIWAVSSNLLPTMIRQLMKTFDLSSFEASLTEASYWIAYFLFPIPIAMFMKRFSYKAGIVVGLCIAALGGILFFPAALIQQYWAYLAIFFIIATGMCFLETAANPYVTVLGDAESAPRRLNLAQSFNGLGAFIAAMFLSKLVLGSSEASTAAEAENLAAAASGAGTGAMKITYLALTVVLLAVAALFLRTRLPEIQEQEGTAGKEPLIDFKVLRHSHLRWGVIAQFFYNGGQTAINSMFLIYCCKFVGIAESTATTFFGLYMFAFLAGRWIGTGLMTRFRPERMLLVYALANMALCGVIVCCGGKAGLYAMLGISFFMSIMYPTQFSLALEGLGSQTKSGSAFLVMAIVGNVVMPPLTGYLMDAFGHDLYYAAYLVPLICFAFCAYYGWRGYRVQ